MTRLSIKIQFVFLTIVLLAALLLIVFISINDLGRTDKTMFSIYVDHVVPMEDLKEVSDIYSIDIKSIIENVLYGRKTWEEGRQIVNEEDTKIKQFWESYLATNHDGEEKELITEAMPIVERAFASLEQLKDYLQKEDQESLEKFFREKISAVSTMLHHEIDKLIDHVKRSAEDKFKQSEVQFVKTKRTFLATSIVVIGLTMVFVYIVLANLTSGITKIKNHANLLAHGRFDIPLEGVRGKELEQVSLAVNQMIENLEKLIKETKHSGIQVSSSSMEMGASIRAQQATATEQSATTTEIAASTKEIYASSQALVKNMDKVANVADSTTMLAEVGQKDLSHMEATMNHMMESARGIANRFAILSEKASNINTVVTTINRVADQTNLLSLNAAIEAEKAGEHGAGFGVVATEIRRLADQTAVATWDIEQMIKEMQTAVSSGVMSMEKFSEEMRGGVEQIENSSNSLLEIVKNVQSLTPHFESVFQSMKEQEQGTEQINQALEELSKTVKNSADSANETVSVVEQLDQASNRLKAAISEFKVLD